VRLAPSAVAVGAAGLALAGAAFAAALSSCRQSPVADDAGRRDAALPREAAPPLASGGGAPGEPLIKLPPEPRGGLGGLSGPPIVIGADLRAQCVVERNVLRRWGVNITTQAGKPPVTVTLPEDVARLACGNSHVCVVTEGGAVWCLGVDTHGELGVTTKACAAGKDLCSSMPPVQVPGLPKMVDVAVSGDMSCAVSEAGEVHCWGGSAWRWLTDAGDGADAQPPPPPETVFRVPGLADVRRISLGSFFACALDARGEVWCWGKNEYGELGRGTSEKRNTRPERVGSLRGASALAAGGSGACALVDGEPLCWGRNAFGDHVEARCKDDWPCTPSPRRVLVPAAAKIVALSSRCMLDAAGSVYCWGDGTPRPPSSGDAGACGSDCLGPPRKVLGIPPMTQIADSAIHVCGLTASRELVCWGDLESLHVSPTENAACGPLFRRPL
jgi:alpha-tubulin suppressor-like RCC1 family protein